MHLTSLRLRVYHKVKGLSHIGKHKVYKPIQYCDVESQWRRLDWEMETMKFLYTPYISEDQEKAYIESRTKPNPLIERYNTFIKHKYFGDQISCLYKNKIWE